jgi:SAM-dependent methyltransferase
MRKSVLQHVWDAVGAPLRMVLLPDDASTRLGFTSLEEERMRAVLPRLRGRLLDVGAGRNTLVRRWQAQGGEGVGVDVHDWGGGAQVIESSSRLPFPDASFDSVTFVACLNHIPDRAGVLAEAARVLRPGGRVVLTMINPVLGEVGHRLWWYSEDKHREEQPGETGGMWTGEILRLCDAAGLVEREHARFVYGLNHVYVMERR